MIKYENRQYWRPVKSEAFLTWPSDDPTSIMTRVLCTVPVTLYAQTLDAEGTVLGDPFLIGVAQPGETPVKVRHGSGLLVSVSFKGGECWLYDEREPHQQEAPVGVTFVSFEKPGHLMDDPMQIIIHRDNVRKTLERQAGLGKPDREAQLMALLERTNKRLEVLEASRETPPADDKAAAGAKDGTE